MRMMQLLFTLEFAFLHEVVGTWHNTADAETNECPCHVEQGKHEVPDRVVSADGEKYHGDEEEEQLEEGGPAENF